MKKDTKKTKQTQSYSAMFLKNSRKAGGFTSYMSVTV